MPEYPHILVATLGGQPQIVTFTLDLLLQEGYPISEVIVLHPRAVSSSRLQRSLHHLNAEFTSNYYRHTIQFHSRVLELNGQPIDDISDNDRADGTLNSIHQLIGDLKRQNYHIHLSISGGRRLMSLLAISVASLNFDRHDHIWHLYTPETFKERADEGAIMHASSDAEIKLIAAPFIALGAYIYAPRQSFRSAQEERRLQLEAQEQEYCNNVVKAASPAQLKVLQAFARGLGPQQIAEELNIALVTVNTHKTALLAYCRSAWNISEKERPSYLFLQTKFATHFPDDG